MSKLDGNIDAFKNFSFEYLLGMITVTVTVTYLYMVVSSYVNLFQKLKFLGTGFHAGHESGQPFSADVPHPHLFCYAARCPGQPLISTCMHIVNILARVGWLLIAPRKHALFCQYNKSAVGFTNTYLSPIKGWLDS